MGDMKETSEKYRAVEAADQYGRLLALTWRQGIDHISYENDSPIQMPIAW